jgi:hypothetical protein
MLLTAVFALVSLCISATELADVEYARQTGAVPIPPLPSTKPVVVLANRDNVDVEFATIISPIVYVLDNAGVKLQLAATSLEISIQVNVRSVSKGTVAINAPPPVCTVTVLAPFDIENSYPKTGNVVTTGSFTV